MTGPTSSSVPIETTFEFVNEPSVIRYTMDGSKPTETSPLWDATGPREPGEVFHVDDDHEFKWIATDIKGNVSHGKQKFTIKAAGGIERGERPASAGRRRRLLARSVARPVVARAGAPSRGRSSAPRRSATERRRCGVDPERCRGLLDAASRDC